MCCGYERLHHADGKTGPRSGTSVNARVSRAGAGLSSSTRLGCEASALGLALDRMAWGDVVDTIAGDDTIFHGSEGRDGAAAASAGAQEADSGTGTVETELVI